MGKFVGVCVGLFVLAVGFVVLTQRAEVAALAEALLSQPLLHQIAWAVIVIVPLVMLPFAVWLWDRLLRNCQAAKTLEQRLDGVWQGVKELGKSQGEADTEVQYLTLNDPEDAIAALKRRVIELEHFAEVQRRRNESGSLELRIEDIRAQQQGLKERLAPVLEIRRSLEQVFAELDSQQGDIDRALAEIASGDDTLAIDIKLKSLSDFVRRSHARCDQIELASKQVANLTDACADVAVRLLPLTSAEDGIKQRLADLTARSESLTAEVDALEFTAQGPLADRLQKLTAGKAKLDDDINHLNAQFFELAGLRKDVSALIATLERGLNAVAIAKNGGGSASTEVCVEELTRFIEQTQSQFDDIESRTVVFGQLRTRLDELQSRLAPLEAEDSGVLKLVGDVQDIRDRLIAKIRHIEGGEEGDLAARVRQFGESKRELEARISNLADQFTKLATIRNDIAGLFDKISKSVSTSSN